MLRRSGRMLSLPVGLNLWFLFPSLTASPRTVCVFEGCCRVGETCPPSTILSASPTSSKHISNSTDVGLPTSTPMTSSGSSTNQGAIIAGCVVGGLVLLSATLTTYKKYQQRRALSLQREANEAMLKTSFPAQQIQPHFMPPPPMQPPQMASIVNEPETPMYPPPWESTMPPSLNGQPMTWQRNDSSSNLNERPSMLPLNYHSPLPWSWQWDSGIREDWLVLVWKLGVWEGASWSRPLTF